MNEREFIRTVLKADPANLSEKLRSEVHEEQRVLQALFGKKRYGRMRLLGRQYDAQREREKRGTVFLLPGILGSELWQDVDEIWLDILEIVAGKFDRLQVDLSGRSAESILAPDCVKIVYGELELSLSRQWSVVRFPYDWRLEIRESARQLKLLIDERLSLDEPLYFVTHSMGALVVRSMLQQYPAQTDRLREFVMLACPNYGTFAIPLLYFGLNEIFELIALAQSLIHRRRELMDWVKMYVGTYQMLPFMGHHPDAQRLCDPVTYGSLNPPVPRFVNAVDLQRELIAGIESPLPPQNPLVAKMTSVLGYGFPTACEVKDWSHLNSRWAYKMTDLGDGNIANSLGQVKGARTYYIDEKHEWVPANPTVIRAVEDILASGSTNQLPNHIPQRRERSSFELQLRGLWQDFVALLQLVFAIGSAHLQRYVKPQSYSWGEARAKYILYGGRCAGRYHQ